MSFCDKIKALRKNVGISQEKLAGELGVTKRMIVNYENGTSLPPLDKVPKIARFFGVSIDSLLTDEEEFISQAQETGGGKGARDAAALVDEVSGLFAGGRLSDDDKDAVMEAIQAAYWIAKRENKLKYTPKRYRQTEE